MAAVKHKKDFLHWNPLQGIITWYMWLIQQPNPHGAATLAAWASFILYGLWTMDNLQQSLLWAGLLSLCGASYLAPVLFKHLEGVVFEKLSSSKPLTSTKRVLHKGVYFECTCLWIKATFWQVKKVCLHDTWHSDFFNPAQWLTAGIGQPADACSARSPWTHRPEVCSLQHSF